MTTDQVLAIAAWPPCPLHLPERVEVGGWGVIFDVPRFIALHMTRLHSESALLRRIAEKNLAAMARKLSPDQPSIT